MLNFKNKRLLIFDLDGTVVDSTKVHAIAWQMAFKKQGIEISPDEIMFHGKGMGYDKRIATLQEVFADRFPAGFDKDQLIKDKDNLFATALKETPVEEFLVPGILQFMLQIKSAGGIIAIASNGKPHNVKLSIEHAGLSGLVSQIEVALSKDQEKPEPYMLNKIMADHSATAEQTIYFGDNKADAKAAKAANIDFCGITAAIPVDPETTISDMKAEGATYIVKSYEDMIRGNVKAIPRQSLESSDPK